MRSASRSRLGSATFAPCWSTSPATMSYSSGGADARRQEEKGPRHPRAGCRANHGAHHQRAGPLAGGAARREAQSLAEALAMLLSQPVKPRRVRGYGDADDVPVVNEPDWLEWLKRNTAPGMEVRVPRGLIAWTVAVLRTISEARRSWPRPPSQPGGRRGPTVRRARLQEGHGRAACCACRQRPCYRRGRRRRVPSSPTARGGHGEAPTEARQASRQRSAAAFQATAKPQKAPCSTKKKPWQANKRDMP